MAKVSGIHEHLIPILQDVAKQTSNAHPSAGVLSRLLRASASIHEVEGRSPELSHVGKLIDEFAHAVKAWNRPGGIAEGGHRQAIQVLAELRGTVHGVKDLKATYAIHKEPNFKEKGQAMEKLGAKHYAALGAAYAGSRYGAGLAKAGPGVHAVHAEHHEERAKLDVHHRASAAAHRKFASQSAPGSAHQKAHEGVARFHENAAALQRQAANHSAGQRGNPNRPTVVGVRGGKYIQLAGGGRWYVGKGAL